MVCSSCYDVRVIIIWRSNRANSRHTNGGKAYHDQKAKKKPNHEKKKTRPYTLIGFRSGIDRAFWFTGLTSGAFQSKAGLNIVARASNEKIGKAPNYSKHRTSCSELRGRRKAVDIMGFLQSLVSPMQLDRSSSDLEDDPRSPRLSLQARNMAMMYGSHTSRFWCIVAPRADAGLGVPGKLGSGLRNATPRDTVRVARRYCGGPCRR